MSYVLALTTDISKKEKGDQPAEYSTDKTALVIVYLLSACHKYVYYGNKGCEVFKRGVQN